MMSIVHCIGQFALWLLHVKKVLAIVISTEKFCGSQDIFQTLRENRAIPDMKDMKLQKLMLKHQNIQNA